MMISINTDKGVDTLLDILRQSQAIKSNPSEDIENDKIDENMEDEDITLSPRQPLRGADTDGDILLSGRERRITQKKNKEECNRIKGMIDGILNRMTAKDYMRLYEEGYKAEDLTIEALANAVEIIKDYGLSKGQSIDKVIDKEDKQIKRRYENILSNDGIRKAMEEENLPVNEDSIERIKAALKLSESIPGMEDKDMLYILKKELPPSIENLYKAKFSKQSKEAMAVLSDEEWERLIPRVKEIIGESKSVEDKAILNDARWLIENEVALTGDNLSLLEGFKDLRQNYSIEMIFDKIFKGMKEGYLPGEAILIEKDTENPEIQSELSLKRQLEEIRLKMILDAAMLMDKKGIHLEIESLERTVERLRLEEELYFRDIYNQNLSDTKETSLNLLLQTTESMNELRRMPIQVLGATLESRRSQTVTGLLEAGRSISIRHDEAQEAYETFFTIPRAEFGDSIKKAFANATSLMEEMGIENTEYNQRAVRILGYNRMEITKEAIEQVKAYDLSLNYLIQNLNPEVAIRLIKDGVNPLDMPIDELNGRIEGIIEEGYSSLDKYSTYLYKLEKNERLSEDERKAYIGIYRLLYQIEKSDGAALGAVIKADQKVTLNHLLTAVRSNKKGEVDHKIRDDFGVLEDIVIKKESISDQLKAAFTGTGEQAAVQEEENIKVTEEVQRAIAKELLNELTPDKLQELHHSILNMTHKSDGESRIADHINVWETIGKLTSEQLLEKIRTIQDKPNANQELYNERLSNIQEVYNGCDRAIRFLNDLQLPCTTTNLLMAGQVLSNSTPVFKRLFGFLDDKEEEKDEKTINRLKKKLEMSDKLIDKESMTEAYDQLEQEVKAVIDEEAHGEQLDSMRLTQLKSMGMQMSFLKNLAKREFYQIPVETSGKITNIYLTIIRGKGSVGAVSVSLLSERLGSIRMDASLKEKKLSAYIACDHVSGLKTLESQSEPLRQAAREEGLTIKQLNFYLQQASDSIYSNPDSQAFEGGKNPETERILYRLAKAMIYTVRVAEEADSARALV